MPGPRALAWGAGAIAAIAGLLALRACLHTAPLDRLAPAAAEPADPPGTSARAGSIFVARGGPVVIGFVAPGSARLTFAGNEVTGPHGDDLALARLIVPAGPAAIRFAAPPGARLVWSPVGRRGPPEYVPASSLAPEPPDRAAFDRPGTAPLDGAIALALLAVVVASLCLLARRRLAAVPRAQWLAMAAVLALALAARLIGLGDAGATWDEDTNWAAGRNYITNVLDLDASASAWRWNYEHPPVMKLLAGIGAQLADGYGPARALSALWCALGCALLVPIGARLFDLRTGALAAAIAALLPPLVAHGQIVGHEAPTVLWWSLGVLLALGAHDHLPDGAAGRRVLIARLAAIGAVVGVAIASRFVNGLLGPLCAIIVAVQAPPAWRRRTLAWGAAVMPVAAIAVFYAVWPRLWADPIGALQASFAKLDVVHAPEPFLGAITAQPGRHYFAVYLVATLPAGVLAAAIGGAVRAALVRDRALIVFAWLLVPLGAAASPVRQDGVRYVMPCLPAIAMLAAAGLVGLAAVIARRWPRRARVPAPALAAAMIAYLALTLARTAPYYLDYFGEHVGGAGTVAARRWFETAWWGEGLDRAVAYVNAHAEPGAAVSRDCVLPQHLTWLREDLWPRLASSPRDAAWILVYAPATRGCRLPPDATLAYEVVHDGAVLAAVYRRPAAPPPAATSPSSDR